jgi:hypothetical protein
MVNACIFVLVPVLWYLGGQKKKAWCRDILVPALVGTGVSLAGHPWIGLICGSAFNIIRLGYGNYDPENDPKPSFLAFLTHDRQGAIIRLIYGVVVAAAGAGALAVAKILPLWGFAGYVVLNGVVGFGVSKLRLPVLPADLLVGAGVGSLLLLCR